MDGIASMMTGIDDLDKKFEIARAKPIWVCYTGSRMEHRHEVGCPHKTWTTEELYNALLGQKAMSKVYQHELFGAPL